MTVSDRISSAVDTNVSAEFLKAREDFASWYDAKSDDEQQLIDEISDRTYYIIDEDEYDDFIDELNGLGITNSVTFQDAFNGEWEGVGEKIYAEFAEQFVDDMGYSVEPEFIRNCVDYELVWYSYLRYDFNTVEFKGNTYFFHNSY